MGLTKANLLRNVCDVAPHAQRVHMSRYFTLGGKKYDEESVQDMQAKASLMQTKPSRYLENYQVRF